MCLEGKAVAELPLSPAVLWHPATLFELRVSWANVKPRKNMGVSKLAALEEREHKNIGGLCSCTKCVGLI